MLFDEQRRAEFKGLVLRLSRSLTINDRIRRVPADLIPQLVRAALILCVPYCSKLSRTLDKTVKIRENDTRYSMDATILGRITQ